MKLYQKIILIVLLLIILGITFFIVDYTHIKNNTKPIFVVTSKQVEDGGTTMYVGIGYKIMKYNVMDQDNNTSKDEYEIRPWFIGFN